MPKHPIIYLLTKTPDAQQLTTLVALDQTYFHKDAFSFQLWKQMQTSHNDYFCLAIDKPTNALVGFCTWHSNDEKTVDLTKIMVVTQFQHQGVGTNLLTILCACNVSKTIFAEVSNRDETAQFYYQNGFEFVAVRNHYYHDNSAALVLQKVVPARFWLPKSLVVMKDVNWV